MTRRFDEFYASALKSLYDAERQQSAELPALAEIVVEETELSGAMNRFAAASEKQAERLEAIFAELYQKPATEACWIVAALLREASDNARIDDPPLMASSVAVALLSVKRYEITRYEALMRWSLHCSLEEALPLLGRSLAEEIVMADELFALAFKNPRLLEGSREDASPSVFPVAARRIGP